MELSTALATRQFGMGVVGDPRGVGGVGVVPAVVAQGGGVVPKQAPQCGPVKGPLWRDNSRVVHVRQLLLSVQIAWAEPELSLSKSMAVRPACIVVVKSFLKKGLKFATSKSVNEILQRRPGRVFDGKGNREDLSSPGC